MRKKGMVKAIGGAMRLDRIQSEIAPSCLNLARERAYAAGTPKNNERSVELTLATALFMKDLLKSVFQSDT